MLKTATPAMVWGLSGRRSGDGRLALLGGRADQCDGRPVPYHARATRVVPVPHRDQVTGPLDDNGVPPAAFRRLFRYHDMTWSDLVPATRYFLGCGIWTCRWVHVAQIGRDQVQVQGALDIRHQASAACVQATGRELGQPGLTLKLRATSRREFPASTAVIMRFRNSCE
jgi:hypothetical protein